MSNKIYIGTENQKRREAWKDVVAHATPLQLQSLIVAALNCETFVHFEGFAAVVGIKGWPALVLWDSVRKGS